MYQLTVEDVGHVSGGNAAVDGAAIGSAIGAAVGVSVAISQGATAGAAIGMGTLGAMALGGIGAAFGLGYAVGT